MNDLPARFEAMLEHGLDAVNNGGGERDELRLVARKIATAVWQHWLAWRLPEDNRPEHEWVVFTNVMIIAEDEFRGEKLQDRLSLKRIATAFAFTHDTFFIPRITEAMIEAEKDPERKKALLKEKKAQRDRHMEGGAKNAVFILKGLKHPNTNAELLSEREIDACEAIIKNHDRWKLDPPQPPPSDDRLAVACLEADALWPLHPLGVLADLERPEAKDNLFAPSDWRKELERSLRTLQEYRSKWTGINPKDFCDKESIFRTEASYSLYLKWLEFWHL
jgi:hypothetical protein